MRAAVAILLEGLTLSIGFWSGGCVERYVVPRAAFERGQEVERGWRTYARPAVVFARRDASGSAVFVRAAALVPDGAPLGGQQRAHTTNTAPATGGVLMVLGGAFAVGAIVLAVQGRSADAASAPSTFSLAGAGDELGAVILGGLAPLAFLSGVGVLAATLRARRFEVGPGHKELIYVGVDGAVHF